MSAEVNLLEHEETLLPLESVEALNPTVVQEKPANVKTANDGKKETKRTETEKMVESENPEYPPLLLDSFKTKAVLAKVFNFLYFITATQ